MGRTGLWCFVALALAAVLTTQLLLASRVEEPPECVCPPPKEANCAEVIHLPCPKDAPRPSVAPEKGQRLDRSFGMDERAPPVQRQPPERPHKQLPPMPRGNEVKMVEDVSDESEGELAARDDVTEEWARRLASAEWHRRCSEAPTGAEVMACLTHSQFLTEDWIAQIKQREEMPSIGEVAKMAEALALEEHTLEMERIRVSGDDLIYGDPGVEGKFMIRTEGYPFGGAVFRVTLEGPEIAYAPVADHQNGNYSGTYLVATAGLYKVTILFESGRYESSAIPSFGGSCDGAVVYQGDLQVTGISQRMPDNLCSSLSMLTYGRHVWTPKGEHSRLDGEEVLRWQPWECALHRAWTVTEFQQCVEERDLGRILLLGESGTFAIYKALGGDAVNAPAYCLFSKDLCEYLPLHFSSPAANDVSTLLPRHMNAWGQMLSGRGPLNTIGTPGRRNILMWNAGVRELIEDQSLSEFAANAHLVNEVIGSYWEGENFYRTSTALHRRCSGEPERYWSLTNERLSRYSSAAEEMVLREGGHILDNYNITVAMRGSTSDVKSYNRELNHELAVLLLNAICIADDWL